MNFSTLLVTSLFFVATHLREIITMSASMVFPWHFCLFIEPKKSNKWKKYLNHICQDQMLMFYNGIDFTSSRNNNEKHATFPDFLLKIYSPSFFIHIHLKRKESYREIWKQCRKCVLSLSSCRSHCIEYHTEYRLVYLITFHGLWLVHIRNTLFWLVGYSLLFNVYLKHYRNRLVASIYPRDTAII